MSPTSTLSVKQITCFCPLSFTARIATSRITTPTCHWHGFFSCSLFHKIIMDSHYHSVLLFLILSAELIQEDSWLNDSMISLRWTFWQEDRCINQYQWAEQKSQIIQLLRPLIKHEAGWIHSYSADCWWTRENSSWRLVCTNSRSIAYISLTEISVLLADESMQIYCKCLNVTWLSCINKMWGCGQVLDDQKIIFNSL